MNSTIILEGKDVILKPLEYHHIEELLEAANENPTLYPWTYVPTTIDGMKKYVDKAMEERSVGTACPFVIIGKYDKQLKGCTRYFNIELWSSVEGHPLARNAEVDVCEIGFTWLRASAMRTRINTEVKFMLLANLFENWKALRVCFSTDANNRQSQNAIIRLGAQFEGILRADRMALGYRDSYRYSILASEWEQVKTNLKQLMGSSIA